MGTTEKAKPGVKAGERYWGPVGIVFGIMLVILVSFTGKVRFVQRGEGEMVLQVRQQPSKALGGSWGGWSRVAGELPKMSRGVAGQVSKAHEDFNTEVNGEPLEGTQ